jgi:hypothetical protein
MVGYIPPVHINHGLGDKYFGRFVDVNGPVVAPYLPQGFKSEVLGAQLMVCESISHVIGAADVLVVKCFESRFAALFDAEEQRPFMIGPVADEDI